MRLPWVSREAYDAVSSANDDMRVMLSTERNRFDRLIDKFTALRVQGATIPETVLPRTARTIDPLTQAVLQASVGKSAGVRQSMLKQLAEDKKSIEAGFMDEVDVMRRIESGFTPDDGIPE